jgi:SHS2 domain-containing protein
MENVNKLLLMAFSAIVFCFGIFVMMNEAKAYHNALTTVRGLFKEEEIYQQYNAEDLETISYAELIATLILPQEYDLMIDGTVISKMEHDADKISGYGIRKTYYRKSYRYDDNGKINLIIYTGL